MFRVCWNHNGTRYRVAFACESDANECFAVLKEIGYRPMLYRPTDAKFTLR